MAGADAFPFTPDAIASAIKKRCSNVLGEFKAWTALGSDVASRQVHEAVAAFIGNSENNAKHVAGPLVQASKALGAASKCSSCPILWAIQRRRLHSKQRFPPPGPSCRNPPPLIWPR